MEDKTNLLFLNNSWLKKAELKLQLIGINQKIKELEVIESKIIMRLSTYFEY